MIGNLLPITEFINEARRQGASFDNGDPKVHLAYLTKLGLLPSAVKRKINGSVQGCYPQDAIATLLEIEHMKAQGMTYAQINKSKSLQLLPEAQISPLPKEPLTFANELVLRVKPSNFAYMFLGIIIGVLVANLNTSLSPNLASTNQSLSGQELILSQEKNSSDPLYLIAVPKQNLDKLEKTNINYLIKN